MAKKSDKNSMVEVSEKKNLAKKSESKEVQNENTIVVQTVENTVVVQNQNNTVIDLTEDNIVAVQSEKNTMIEGDASKTTKKKTKGRQKVPMVRMEDDSKRLVTFSKRRNGLFKKASELCTLCGAEAAIIVFSPGRKVFSFGHPSVDSIINRYFLDDSGNNNPNFDVGQTSQAHNDQGIDVFTNQLTILNNHLEIEKKKYETILGVRKSRENDFQWLGRVEEFDREGLKNLQQMLMKLKNDTFQLYCDLEVETNKKAKAFGKTVLNFSPLEIVGGQNPVSANFSCQPNPMVISHPNLVEGHNNYDRSQMMIPFPMGGFGDPSLSLRLNGMFMNDSDPSMPNPMVLGFQAPTFWPPFQGENNSMGGGQFGGYMLVLPYYLQGVNPMSGNFQTFIPMITRPSSSNAPTISNPMLPGPSSSNAPSTFNPMLPGTSSSNAPSIFNPMLPGSSSSNAQTPPFNHQGE